MPEAEPRPLELRDLSRYYGEVVGLEGLDLVLEPGEVFGLVGLNGAGKSTTIRLALGLSRPSRGRALLFGRPARQAIAERRRLGYLPSELALWGERTGAENLEFLGRLAGLSATTRQRRAALAHRLGLSSLDLGRKVREMSHGMRQKLGIIQALEHEPDLVVLDEPSDGLDPLARELLTELLGEVRRRGGTVLLASHVLGEIERVADRVGVLHRGALVALETARSLKERERLRIVATFSGAPPELAELAEVEVVEQGAGRVVLRARPPLDALVKRLARSVIADLRVEEPTLEDLVRRIAEGSAP